MQWNSKTVTIQNHPLSLLIHTMSIILLLFTSFIWWGRKNLRSWNTLKIQVQLLQSIKHIYEMMFYNKTRVAYPCTHACTWKQTDWNKKSRLYFFLSCNQNLTEHQLCVPNWKYSSEGEGAYNLAARQPITFIILTLLLLYVLWTRPGAKRRLIRKSWPTSRNQMRSPWGRNT